MRLPNGYGTVTKLSGKRRKPFRARKTIGWEYDEEKDRVVQKFLNIGYYATKQEALQALALYNANPYEIKPSVTFSEVYDMWSEKKFETVGFQSITKYKNSFNICKAIHNVPFTDLKLSHLQGVIDNYGKNYPILSDIKLLYSQLFDYAVKYEIISSDKHIVKFVEIGKKEKSELHYTFNKEEIKILWDNARNDEYIQLILMLIYSGVRPGELFALKRKNVNLEERSFWIEKGKTANATRKVPIHKDTFAFFKHWYNKECEYLIVQPNGEPFNFLKKQTQYANNYWNNILFTLGIYEYKNDKGKLCEHKPDDTRHTFASLWHEKKLNEPIRRKIQGHSGKGIGEEVYTHLSFETLREELDKL